MQNGPEASRPPHDLIDAPTLAGLLGSTGLCILDCRHDLARPDLGREQYLQAHIPGAVFASLDEDLSGAKSADTGRHPLPSPLKLLERLRAWGARADSTIVAYDASEGSFAARAWWLVRWLGHADVLVLDGGWQGWVAAGLPVSRDVPEPTPGDIIARPRLARAIDVDTVLALSRQELGHALLVDARSPDRYEGRNETFDPVGGHIPGAVNRFWRLNLRADGHFKAPETLRAEYEALMHGYAPAQVIFQCGSGVSACHNILAMHVAGLPGAALFPGSWSQWVADPLRPVAVGPEPG